MLEAILQAIEAYPADEGLSLSGVMALPDPLGPTLNRMIRRGSLTLPDLSATLGLALDDGRLVAELLVARGLVSSTERDGQMVYRARLARKQGREFSGPFRDVIDDL